MIFYRIFDIFFFFQMVKREVADGKIVNVSFRHEGDGIQDQTGDFKMMTEPDISSLYKPDFPTLTIQEAGVVREEILDETQYTLGRGVDCQLILADNNVSRHHAELKFNGTAWCITDLDSVNGTFVNTSPVSSVELKHMDTIQIGSAVLIFNDPHHPGEVEQWNNVEDPEASNFNFESMQRVIRRLEENIATVFKGNPEVIRDLIVCLMADGHLLLEDAPGVGKSLLAQTLAKSVQGKYKRIQFTPDMLPSDITGMNIYDDMKKDTRFLPGPIFGNVILADEINRTTPRTQSSLLECMSEAVITLDGKRHILPKPFFVIATQNPNDYQGTYPLPEPQLDRFLMRLSIGYPTPEAEKEILDSQMTGHVLSRISYVIRSNDVLRCQALVRQVAVSDAIKEYMIAIANATRHHEALVNGISPRATLALMRSCQSLAAYNDRNYVTPHDVRCMLKPVFSHRLNLKLKAKAQWRSVDDLLDKIAESVKLKNEDTI